MTTLKTSCPKCGRKNKEGRFCSECGTSLVAKDKKVIEEKKGGMILSKILTVFYIAIGVGLVALFFLTKDQLPVTNYAAIKEDRDVLQISDFSGEITSNINDGTFMNYLEDQKGVLKIVFKNGGTKAFRLKTVPVKFKLKNPKTEVIEFSGETEVEVNIEILPGEQIEKKVPIFQCGVLYNQKAIVNLIVNDTINVSKTIQFKN